MKILVISDSHGNITNLKHVVGFGGKIGVEGVIHAGDWNTVQSVKSVLAFGIPLYTVLGNADIDPDVGKILKARSKRFDNNFLELELGGKKIGITHKPSDNAKFFADIKLDIIFNGHLHSKFEVEKNGVKIVRPGAVILGANFAIYDTHTGGVSFIEENGIIGSINS